MKTFTLAIPMFLLFISGLQAQVKEWKELEDFHYTLGFTYHPMADDSNFKPIRTRSAELATKADTLERSIDRLPVKNTRLEVAIESLAEQTKALDDVIHKNASDSVIRVRLTAIHNKFHEIERIRNESKE